MKKLILLLLLTPLIFFSCTKSANEMANITGDPTLAGQVLVCNEGNFMYSNSTVTLYNPESKIATNQAFATINGFPLGDMLQSAAVADGYLFLVVNNSGKVEVCNAENLRYVATITGLTSPRYIAWDQKTAAAGGKIYITDLYSNTMTVVSLATLEVVATVDLGMTSEQILYRDGYLYTCAWINSRAVVKIDVATLKIVGRVDVALQPNSLTFDAHGRLWVLSDGGLEGTPVTPESPAISCIDVESFKLLAQYKLPQSNPTELCASPDGRTLYFLGGAWGGANGGVFEWAIDGTESRTKIPGASNLFYGLGVNPRNGDLYVSDSIDYVQRGVVYRYSATGEMLASFKADIIPGAFCFL